MGVVEFGGHMVRGFSQSACLKFSKTPTQLIMYEDSIDQF